MKKLFSVLVALCLLCSVALAEEKIELNWTDFNTEEIQSLGEFQQIEIPDMPTIVYWIPTVRINFDV